MPWIKAQKRGVAVVLLVIGEASYELESPMHADLFMHAVEDVPFEAITAAADEHVRTATFFPKPPEHRNRVLGNVDDQAELAWQSLLREVRRVGGAAKPAWSDAVTRQAALGLFGGGWRTLCERSPADGPELLGYREQFVALFGAAVRFAQIEALPLSRDEAMAALAEVTQQLARRGRATGESRRRRC